MAKDWKSFFNPDQARGASADPDVGQYDDADAASGDTAPLPVGELVWKIKRSLERSFPQRVTVVGEISNLKRHSSGHLYFRLKDADAAIDATMFRSHASRLKFEPIDGLEVTAEGRVDVYEVRGQLQIRVEKMTPKGAGALELAFRRLCDKLRAEGLFDPDAKQPICRFPRAIGVITSQTGAAIRDIRNTLQRRWAGARVYLVSSLVQGHGAAEQLARAVELLDANAEKYQIDTIIVARGGGSLEDLWAFNEEVLARAIFAAQTPIINGVGHEMDVTIADMVADVRSATPTAAAELAVPDAAEVARELAAQAARLARAAGDAVRAGRIATDAILRSVVFRDPLALLRTHMQRNDELAHRLSLALRKNLADSQRRLGPAANRLAGLHPAALHQRAVSVLADKTHRLAWSLGARANKAGQAVSALAGRLLAADPRHGVRLNRQKISAMARQLEAMSYKNVLARGFTVTRSGDGAIVRSADALSAGQSIRSQFIDGSVTSRVTGTPGRPGLSGSPAPARRPGRARQTPGGTLFDITDEKRTLDQ